MRFLILIITLVISVFAKAQQPLIITTTTMIADMTQQIAGDKFVIKHLVPVGGDPHLYDPIPQDATLVAKADLIFINGLTLEGWLKEFITNSGTKAELVTVTEGIKPIESLTYKNAADPHAWMDATNGVIYAENIKKALIKYDPQNSEMYEANFKNYKRALEELDVFIRSEIEKIPEKKRVLITSHDAFQYFGRQYGIRLEAVLGISTDAEAQTSDIIRVQKVIRATEIPSVFIESTVNPKLIQQIARDTKVSIGGSLYADSLGEPGSEGDTYIGMLRYNVKTIVEGLTKEVAIEEGEAGINWLFTGVVGLMLLGGFFYMFTKMNKT